MNDNDYPSLSQFLGAYFHQDFMLDYGSPDGAITTFLAEASPEFVAEVCNDLINVILLLERTHDHENFLWRVLGCNYRPIADGLTIEEWLKHVHEKICE